jgi:hypothetical protein
MSKTMEINEHYRTRCKQNDLLPHSPTFLLADTMDLVKDDPDRVIKTAVLKRKAYLRIREVQTEANGGDKSMMASISGTVTKIWHFCGLWIL